MQNWVDVQRRKLRIYKDGALCGTVVYQRGRNRPEQPWLSWRIVEVEPRTFSVPWPTWHSPLSVQQQVLQDGGYTWEWGETLISGGEDAGWQWLTIDEAKQLRTQAKGE
ncbi:hypothetical protein [Bowmanella denitrificans]|uniref:hypothetical protein n=1 Tax=Bowmanella denitrificans TaxID=366582 RepID=UPI000C9A3498|nr:hypothetical protein [Bowmanella denitrificans]